MWMETYSGTRVIPTGDNDPDAFCIDDIAHSLALQCRYRGHCRTFYSIAEHSVRAAWLVRTMPMPDEMKPTEQLAALMHDAAEAYLGDQTRPVKGLMHILSTRSPKLLTMSGAEDLLHAEIDLALDLSYPHNSPFTKRADAILLATEARDLMATGGQEWTLEEKPLDTAIYPWTWEVAKSTFLDTYTELVGQVQETETKISA